MPRWMDIPLTVAELGREWKRSLRVANGELISSSHLVHSRRHHGCKGFRRPEWVSVEPGSRRNHPVAMDSRSQPYIFAILESVWSIHNTRKTVVRTSRCRAPIPRSLVEVSNVRNVRAETLATCTTVSASPHCLHIISADQDSGESGWLSVARGILSLLAISMVSVFAIYQVVLSPIAEIGVIPQRQFRTMFESQNGATQELLVQARWTVVVVCPFGSPYAQKFLMHRP